MEDDDAGKSAGGQAGRWGREWRHRLEDGGCGELVGIRWYEADGSIGFAPVTGVYIKCSETSTDAHCVCGKDVFVRRYSMLVRKVVRSDARTTALPRAAPPGVGLNEVSIAITRIEEARAVFTLAELRQIRREQ